MAAMGIRARAVKRAIDWARIKTLYESGVRPPTLAKRFPVSKQGIMKRARREGWALPASRDPPTGWLPVARATDIAHARATGSALGKRSPETVATVLEHLADGVPEGLSADAAGISRDTLRRWKSADSSFADACQRARGTAAAARIRRLADAGKRGDWKADAYMLERMEGAREEFSSAFRPDRKLHVIINVERGPGVNPEPIEVPVYDALDDPDGA